MIGLGGLSRTRIGRFCDEPGPLIANAVLGRGFDDDDVVVGFGLGFDEDDGRSNFETSKLMGAVFPTKLSTSDRDPTSHQCVRSWVASAYDGGSASGMDLDLDGTVNNSSSSSHGRSQLSRPRRSL